jgi:CRISPR/Cas system CSM-associated protein Csm3 (group 7 of RAMP superfamily)
MASELRKTILEIDDIQKEIVTVPEWGNIKIEVRSIDSKTRARILQRASKDGALNLERWFPELVVATAHDPDTGEKLFEAADVDALNSKNGNAINRISTVAQRLAGMMEADVEDAKQDFGETQSDVSTSS